MSQNPYQQTPHADHYATTPQKKSGCMKYAVIGCLGVILLSVIFGCLGGYWAYQNGRTLVADTVNKAMKQAVSEMNLPGEQGKDIQEQLDHVAGLFKEGKLSVADFGELASKFQNAPVYAAGLTQVFKVRYLDQSGLSETEKADGARDLARLAHGVQTEKVSMDEVDPLTRVMFEDQARRQNLRETLSDDEIRQFLSQTKQLADSHNLPEVQVEQIDFAADFKKIVRDFLEEKNLPALPDAE